MFERLKAQRKAKAEQRRQQRLFEDIKRALHTEDYPVPARSFERFHVKRPFNLAEFEWIARIKHRPECLSYVRRMLGHSTAVSTQEFERVNKVAKWLYGPLESEEIEKYRRFLTALSNSINKERWSNGDRRTPKEAIMHVSHLGDPQNHRLPTRNDLARLIQFQKDIPEEVLAKLDVFRVPNYGFLHRYDVESVTLDFSKPHEKDSLNTTTRVWERLYHDAGRNKLSSLPYFFASRNPDECIEAIKDALPKGKYHPYESRFKDEPKPQDRIALLEKRLEQLKIVNDTETEPATHERGTAPLSMRPSQMKPKKR